MPKNKVVQEALREYEKKIVDAASSRKEAIGKANQEFEEVKEKAHLEYKEKIDVEK